ncbi:molybdate transport system substrate-binding protein [Fusobacterium naviforme]|nr:molybdate ABC transporter substrate-binding protein [Fusobacterium naviforme]PSL10068.1 molybdate transport system substrate-binding protein [Fusobacterium naviforme]STO27477.1 Molybdate-binding periplasmic protein precursor [Fusobacterium naviforme]
MKNVSFDWKSGLLTGILVFGAVLLASCGSAGKSGSSAASAEAETEESAAESTAESTAAVQTELYVFAAASMTETMDQIIQLYEAKHPDTHLVATYDSSGTLLKQIQEGAECDLFVSAAQKQMNALEEAGSLLEGSRVDLLENKVTLAVPEGNPSAVESFDALAERLKAGDILLGMGNSDVPVGQYTQKIFAYYGLDEEALASSGVLTYGSNVKEVTTQVKEAAVDCGVIYATDAHSAGLTVVDSATKEMCGQVIYPAAVLKESAHAEAAQEFLAFLKTHEAAEIFEGVGFTAL